MNRLPSIPLGTYVPGDTVIHRIPAGMKLIFLIGFIVVATLSAKTLPLAGFALAAALTGYIIARIPFKIAIGQLLPPLPIVLLIFVFQWWQLGLITSLVLVIVLYAAIVAATLLTLTTRLAAMMDAFERTLRPFSRFGLPVATISLALSLTIRLIPLQFQAVSDTMSARKARGADNSLRALIVPVVVRSIRRAEGIGDALWARGVGD